MNPYYSDELVTLYHGDCREITEWLAADVLVTDPPYGIAWRGSGRQGSPRTNGIANDDDTSARDAALTLWGDRPAAVFGSPLFPPAGARQALAWKKPPNSGILGSYGGFRRDWEPIYLCGKWRTETPTSSGVLTSGARSQRNPSSCPTRYQHPHAKPVDLLETLLGHCPTGVIADPFAGSGSTLAAAKLSGRHCIGVEIEERYCEVIANRLSQGVLTFGESA